MYGVLVGFAVIGLVVFAGYLVRRLDVLPGEAQRHLNLFVFFAASPALLFTVVAKLPVASLFTEYLLVALIALVSMVVISTLVSRFFLGQPAPESLLAGLASGVANTNNMGLPVAAYVLGGEQYAAPVLMLQVVMITPLSLALLDITVRGRVSWKDVALQPVRNPIIIGSLLGFVVSVTGLQLPAEVYAPFELLGGAAIPVILFAFGMSLRGSKPLADTVDRRPVVFAVLFKMVAMPLTAWLLGKFVFGLSDHLLFAATVVAALPTAQNVWNYAVRFQRGEQMVRDIVLFTTFLSMPVILLIALLLGV